MKKMGCASEMPQWVKVCASKPDDLSWIPGIHIEGREN